ncbi:hypothetical protein XAC2911_1020001 [Xanthomonas citri pv. citri]|nr:hypothetical protein XAC2911_1020001 [Xanthomonas citri pv. citri]
MDTSESAIFHGLEMSRKSWAYQTPFQVSDYRLPDSDGHLPKCAGRPSHRNASMPPSKPPGRAGI